MDFQDLGVKEVNAYYARQGGIRTAAVNGYANICSFPALMQKAAAQARAATQAEATAQARGTTQAGTAAQARAAVQAGTAAQARTAAQAGTAAQARAAVQAGTTAQHKAAQMGTAARTRKAAETNEAVQTEQSSNNTLQTLSDNGNICCDKCQAVSQVVLQMMSRNLYAQSALGYPLTGAGSWMAYQNMANLLGGSLF